MNTVDYISLFCAMVSLIVTILLGIWQNKQTTRMNNFEIKQANIESNRYTELVDIEARKFILQHYKEIEYLPLCPIAFLYNKTRKYHRRIYFDFCLLTEDVRNQVLAIRGLKKYEIKSENFFDVCFSVLKRKVSKCDPKSLPLLKGDGWYLESAILFYGNESKDISIAHYTNNMTRAEKNNESIKDRENHFQLYNKICKTSEKDVLLKKLSIDIPNRKEYAAMELDECRYACLTIWLFILSEEAKRNKPVGINDTCPETMEDIFLFILQGTYECFWE